MRAYALSDVSRLPQDPESKDLLGDDLEVCIDLTTVLNSLLAGLNAALVVALLEFGGTQICHVGNVLVCLPGLCVVLNRLVKLTLLVELGTLLLQLIRLDLCLLGGLLLFCLLDLRLRLRLRLFLGLCRCGAHIGHLDVLLCLSSSGAGSTLLARSTELHVNAQENAHDLERASVLHEFAHPVGVALQLLELLHEGRVCEKRGCLGVASQLLDHVWVVEHAAETS